MRELFEFVGGPRDGRIDELPVTQVEAFVVRLQRDHVSVYRQQDGKFVYAGQITFREYSNRVAERSFQPDDGTWPPAIDFDNLDAPVSFYEE